MSHEISLESPKREKNDKKKCALEMAWFYEALFFHLKFMHIHISYS